MSQSSPSCRTSLFLRKDGCRRIEFSKHSRQRDPSLLVLRPLLTTRRFDKTTAFSVSYVSSATIRCIYSSSTTQLFEEPSASTGSRRFVDHRCTKFKRRMTLSHQPASSNSHAATTIQWRCICRKHVTADSLSAVVSRDLENSVAILLLRRYGDTRPRQYTT